MKLNILLFLLVASSIIHGNAQSSQIVANKIQNPVTPYSINNPDMTFEMPEILKEISGLSIAPNQEHLCAINDEQGIIFFIDKKDGTIARELKFHKNGDYEGIETVRDHIYIVKSSGTVYKVKEVAPDSVNFKKGKYLLRKENDTEGLCFDSENNQLLFACKGRACLHSGCQIDGCLTKKSIYSMDLKKNRVSEEPFFEITLTDVQAFLKKNKSEEALKKFDAFTHPEDGQFHFHPSALAIHPITLDVYILASKGKTLIVLNNEGKIIYMEKLKKKVHAQPEGIAFDSDGTLYISNEGKKQGNGKICVFKYHKT